MTFDAQQKDMLAAPLLRGTVKTRKQGGRQVSYIEGWHAIDEANRIFGFDGWTRETVYMSCVAENARKVAVTETFAGYDGWGVTYICRVRIIVDDKITREGCGAGHGIDRDLGQAHESAVKEAETDAMKRALMTFGNPFGLALYDKSQSNVADALPGEPEPEDDPMAREDFIRGCEQEIERATDPAKLSAWWKSKQQSEARRKYLSIGEYEVLKAKLITKGELLTNAKGQLPTDP